MTENGVSLTDLPALGRPALGVALAVAGVLLVRWAAGVWWVVMLSAWSDALRDPSYRHDDWLRVDVWGNFVEMLRVVASGSPVAFAIAAVLVVTGVGLVAWPFLQTIAR